MKVPQIANKFTVSVLLRIPIFYSYIVDITGPPKFCIGWRYIGLITVELTRQGRESTAVVNKINFTEQKDNNKITEPLASFAVIG